MIKKLSKNWGKNKSSLQSDSRLIIYFRVKKEKDRFVLGDRYLLQLLRRLIKGKQTSGIGRVFINLCHSFDLLNVKYLINLPFRKLRPSDRLIVLGVGKYALENYNKPNKLVAGIALMTHPSEWPELCTQYPIAKYLQHSKWAKDVYLPYYGSNICDTWFSGVDTDIWKPRESKKKIDILIYNKINSSQERNNELRAKIIKVIEEFDLTYKEVIYGKYNSHHYKKILSQSKSMIFLSEHESQGFACCEAMAMNVPIFAWDQGLCLDPNRFNWGTPIIPATSVPFFDERCGDKFKDINDFNSKITSFLKYVKEEKYSPRDFVLQNLSLEKSGKRMLKILNQVYS